MNIKQGKWGFVFLLIKITTLYEGPVYRRHSVSPNSSLLIQMPSWIINWFMWREHEISKAWEYW